MTLEWPIINKVVTAGTDAGGKMLLDFITEATARGWIVKGSGDGVSTFQNEGQTAGPYNILGAVSGTWDGGGISHRNVWLRIREPSPSTREFIFWRGNNATSGWSLFNILISITPLNSGASATVAPTTGAKILNSTQMSAVNTNGMQMFGNTSMATHTGFYYSIGFRTQVAPGDVWPFFISCTSVATSALSGALGYESLVNTIPGESAHPFVVFAQPGAGLTVGNMSSGSNGNQSVSYAQVVGFAGTLTNTVAATDPGSFMASYNANGTIQIGGAGTSLPELRADSKYVANRVYHCIRVTSGFAIKGICEHLKWNPLVQTRLHPNTLNLASASPYIFWGAFLLPWKTNTVPLP